MAPANGDVRETELNWTLLCGPPIGRIMRLARPSIRLSVCLSFRVSRIQGRNSKTKDVEKSKLL